MTALTWLLFLGLATSCAAQWLNSIVDDDDSSIAYSNLPAWSTNIPQIGKSHTTEYPGASATLSFYGTAVHVYGQKGKNHGFRNISVDSGSPIQCDGRTGQIGSQALLFSTTGLPQGGHTITVTHTGMQGECLDIDYFLVTQGGQFMPQARQVFHVKRATADIAVIAGGAGGGTVLVLALLMLIFYCIGRRKRRLSGTPSVLTKRSRTSRVPLSNSTHYPGPSTEPIFDPHPSAHYPYSSNPSSMQEYNPYHPTAQMSVQYSEPRSTLGSASIYSNQTLQVAQTVPNRRSPESRPMSTVSQPLSTVSQSLSTVSQPLSTASQPLSTVSQSTISHPISLRSGSHSQANPYQQGSYYQQGSPFQQGDPYQHGVAYRQGGPYHQGDSHQQGRSNYAGIGAGPGPLVMSYDANAEQSRLTHLPEKRRPEEMDPVYQSSTNLAGSSSAPIHALPRVQSTSRPIGTEQDEMPPPPGYFNEKR